MTLVVQPIFQPDWRPNPAASSNRRVMAWTR
jgi:hypothetical protein